MIVKKILVWALLFCLPVQLLADKVDKAIDAALKDMVEVSTKTPYSRIIEKMLLGYSDQGEIMVGIAIRQIASYKPVTGMIAVRKTPAGYVIETANMPDISKIRPKKKRDLVLSALIPFRGKTVVPEAERPPVDGITGATRYSIRVHNYFNIMAMKLVEEMEKGPDWPKEKLD